MKFYFFIILTVFAFSAHTQQILNSEISEVTVFQNGAQVTRQLKFKLNPGVQDVVIKSLAEHIDPGSIRIVSDPECILQAVRHEVNYINSAEDKSQELKKKRELLLDDAAKINQQLAILKFEKTMLEKNQTQIIGVSNSTLKLDDLKALLEFQKLKLNEILPKIYEQDKKLQVVQQEIDKINRQIQEFDQNKLKPSSDLVLTIFSKTAGNREFQLQYYVANAGWTLHYDIMVKDIKSPLDLLYKAMVNQSTGEDWKNVRMNLSTANPFESTQRPQLNPWYLRNEPPVAYQNYRRNAPMQNKVLSDNMPAMEAGTADLFTEAEQVSSRVYRIDIPYTVLSNNKAILVEVKKATVKARYSYFAIPKLDKDAFLTAEVDDWEELNLMDGEANLFFEGTYQGKSYIDTRSIQDFLRLSLGRDKNISLERNKIKDYSKNKFLSDKKIISKGWEIIIKNKKNTSIDIIIEDQLPISTEKSIVVKAEDLSGAELTEETGKLRWVLKVSADEQKKLKLRYSVECPKDYVLNLE